MSDDEGFDLAGAFPEEPRPVTPPLAFADYSRINGDKIALRLVNKHPLWGHVLYPTSKVLSRYLERNPHLVAGKNVLELGAAASLPSIISCLLGAKQTVSTDFPDASLLSNIEYNARTVLSPEQQQHFTTLGYTWGSKVSPLLEAVDLEKYDVVIAADLVFNHSQHDALLRSCSECIKPAGAQPMVLLFYSHHRPTPELIGKDEGFAKLAESKGWTCERVVRDESAGPAFPEDGGDLSIRSTVHGFILRPPAVSSN